MQLAGWKTEGSNTSLTSLIEAKWAGPKGLSCWWLILVWPVLVLQAGLVKGTMTVGAMRGPVLAVLLVMHPKAVNPKGKSLSKPMVMGMSIHPREVNTTASLAGFYFPGGRSIPCKNSPWPHDWRTSSVQQWGLPLISLSTGMWLTNNRHGILWCTCRVPQMQLLLSFFSPVSIRPLFWSRPWQLQASVWPLALPPLGWPGGMDGHMWWSAFVSGMVPFKTREVKHRLLMASSR